jgi:hypothetical protein
MFPVPLNSSKILEDVREECNPSIPKEIIDQFLKSVMKRISVHVKRKPVPGCKRGSSQQLSFYLLQGSGS